jgi:activator of HSP90 ATPase
VNVRWFARGRKNTVTSSLTKLGDKIAVPQTGRLTMSDLRYDLENLRLIKAFFKIKNPAVRQAIIEFVEMRTLLPQPDDQLPNEHGMPHDVAAD